MSDFDDLVSAERRRLDEQAAAHAAGENARRRGDLPEWQRVVARVQDLLSSAARHLRDAGVPPVPVLEARKPNERLQLWGFELAAASWSSVTAGCSGPSPWTPRAARTR
ncbi:hypothetical protein ACFQY7_36290 [Actinomadura luteofluorescens]|uniref:hypothetical protein n=1 Tax=Actinomadura luteofluorescens TaxID=46163 RepID=UPI00364145FF